MIMALLLIAILGPAGYTPPFAKGALEKVDQSISFRALQRDPDTFKGRWVMLAGVIIEARNTKEGTSIEVLQRPMDRWGSRMKRMPWRDGSSSRPISFWMPLRITGAGGLPSSQRLRAENTATRRDRVPVSGRGFQGIASVEAFILPTVHFSALACQRDSE